jgi:hypothetical protein
MFFCSALTGHLWEMTMSQNDLSRRDFLKGAGLGAAAVTFSGKALAGQHLNLSPNQIP